MFRWLDEHRRAVDAVLAAGFLLVCLLQALASRSWLDVPVALLFSLTLVLRRVTPGRALALAWAATAVQLAALISVRIYDCAVLVVLYATASYGGARVRRSGLLSALAGSAVAAVYLTAVLSPTGGRRGSINVDPASLLALFVAALVTLVLAWTWGLLVRTRRAFVSERLDRSEAERARLAAELLAAQEHERSVIAREVHDVVAHSLAVVIAQTDSARYAGAHDRAAVDGALLAIGHGTVRARGGPVPARHAPCQ